MAADDIDAYLAALDDTKRSTLDELRQSILAVVPEAEQGMSYGMPAFKVRGKTVAGFAAFKNHLSYLPHSGSVLSAICNLASIAVRRVGQCNDQTSLRAETADARASPRHRHLSVHRHRGEHCAVAAGPVSDGFRHLRFDTCSG